MTKTVRGLLTLVCLSLLGPVPTAGADERPGALIIDTHLHVRGDDEKKFPFAHPYEPKFVAPKAPASPGRVVKEMDEYGVSQCVLVQTIYNGWDKRYPDHYLAHCLNAHPQRSRGQALIDPTDPKVAEKFEEVMKTPGMAGARFSPVYYKGKDEWLDAKPSRALWKKAEKPGAVFNFFIAS